VNTHALMLHIQEPALAAAAGAGEVGEAPARDIGAGHRDLGDKKGRGGGAYMWALCYCVHTKWSHIKMGRIN
jgi:hypothetical protein